MTPNKDQAGWLGGAVVALLLAGGLLTLWTVFRADHAMRAELLQQTQMVAQGLDRERVQDLTGTEADLANPSYLRIKDQLAAVRSSNPLCRFIYLLGRKSDGEIFFFVDSEPTSSKDCSPAGQTYDEVTNECRRAFSSHSGEVEGPYTDRWGTWISGFVPILAGQMAHSKTATPLEAQSLVHKAVNFYRRNGRERFLKELNQPAGEFCHGDLYAFVYDLNMTMLAQPIKPELVGKNMLDIKDWPGGKYFRREIQQLARTSGNGWVNYEYVNPANKAIEPKTSYIERVDDLIVCAGSYKGTGGILAVLGMDVDARTLNWLLVRGALPPALLTVALTAILLFGSTLRSRRARINGVAPPFLMRHLEAMLTAVLGLVLTLFAAWIVFMHATDERRKAFEQVTANRSEPVVEKLRFLRDIELASLVRFYEGNDADVSPEAFRYFTAYLAKNPIVQAWEWIPAVKAGDRPHREANERAAGMGDGEIWQFDAQGKRVPASGRNVYYPVYRVTPLAGNERMVGYDLGSEPLCRAMFEEASRTGLPAACKMIARKQEDGRLLLACRPVFDNKAPKNLLGFVAAELSLDELVQGEAPDNALFRELSLLHSDGTSELLATSWDAATGLPKPGLSITRPLFAFGKVFALTSHAETKIFSIFPMSEWWLTFLGGMMITGSLSILVGQFLSRRMEMERMIAERKLLAKAIGQTSEAIFITDEQGRIQYINPSFVSLTGYTREEAIGQNPRILKSGKQDAPFYRDMWKTLLSGRTWKGRLVNKKKDGSLFTEESTISPIHDSSNKIVNFVAVKRDITQQLSLELQLNQAQKMESVGRLAGGVAHDFNNMLCVILGHTELAMEQVSPAHPLFEDLQCIRSSAQRSADLTRQLLAFSRQQPISPKMLDLNESIAGMLSMLTHLIGEDVHIVSQPAKDLWLVRMDPSQVDQIMVNLCSNARDALTNGGTITIQTDNRTFEETTSAGHSEPFCGEYVCLTVSDTGCGMNSETLDHLFEPFFTTKDVGKGTGLGLATVYGIIKQNHGCILARSELGKGTIFTIWLPRHHGEISRPQPAEEETPLRGNETILLVEDEPAIMNMTQMILERLGYTVLATNFPDEAIRAAESHAGKISLLITDVIMPGMNGRELSAALLARHPHLKCLFMSGYTANVITPHGVLVTGARFIQKPFSMGDLSVKIREALDS